MKIAPAGVLVLVGLAQHLGIDARENAGQHLVTEPLEVAHARAGDRVEDPLPQRVAARVGRSPQAKLDVRPQVARELRPRHQAVAIGGAAEVDRARPLDQRLVEVEEGARAS